MIPTLTIGNPSERLLVQSKVTHLKAVCRRAEIADLVSPMLLVPAQPAQSTFDQTDRDDVIVVVPSQQCDSP